MKGSYSGVQKEYKNKITRELPVYQKAGMNFVL